MIEVTLQQIQEWIPCDIDSQYLRQTIKGVTIDSRAIKTNMLFIPFKGENVDGHRFVSQALKDGAGASFYEKGHDIDDNVEGPIIWVDDTLIALQQLAKAYLKHVNPKVIGVTGSNGKTTTKDMIESVLHTEFKVKKTQGNYNNEIGLPLIEKAMPSFSLCSTSHTKALFCFKPTLKHLACLISLTCGLSNGSSPS